MINIICLNPAIDYKIEMKCLSKGKLNHIDDAQIISGGKGVNVAKILSNFAKKSNIYGFLGGNSGEIIKKDLKKNFININQFWTEIKDETRINIKINDDMETEIAGKSPNIKKDEIEKFFLSLKSIKNQDIVVLSGSIPQSLGESFYERIIEFLPKDIKLIIDTRGKTLKTLIKYKPFFIKPNLDELVDLCGYKLKEEDLIQCGMEFLEKGVKNLIVSLGDNGSYFFNQNLFLRANPINGKFLNSTGAGDSMVAMFVNGILENLEIRRTYEDSVLLSSYRCFTRGEMIYKKYIEYKSSLDVKNYVKIVTKNVTSL